MRALVLRSLASSASRAFRCKHTSRCIHKHSNSTKKAVPAWLRATLEQQGRGTHSTLSPAAAAPHPATQPTVFCRSCGNVMEQRVPDGDTHMRNVCLSCGFIEYLNPKMVVGAIIQRDDGRLLLCRRGIEPCLGKWTVPAGYLECQESTAQGAAREALEEANCAVEILAPYTHFDVVTINQAYIIFRARATSPEAACAGDETLEVKWVNPHEICFDELAFSSISLALRLYVEDLEAGRFRVHYGVIDKTPGAGPNQPGTFVLQQHMALAVARER